MNVAFDPWVPVVTCDGTKQLVSLHEIFTQGDRLADLAVRPHERVALMRLLLCVAHAALDGPKDYDEWCDVPNRLPEEANRYLTCWKDSFELFHPERPWLQVAALTRAAKEEAVSTKDWSPVSKLAFFYASGANTTLFDHSGMNNWQRSIECVQTLVDLLAFQCFSPGGLISQVYWSGRQTSKSSKDGPCCPASMMHAFLRGSTLVRSIHLNLPNYGDVQREYGDHPIGRPLWEAPPKSFADKPAIENATSTYLGRLVPMTRVVRLHSSGGSMLLGDGLVYPTFLDGFPAELSATVILRRRQDKEERALLSFRPELAIWRALGAVVTTRHADRVGGPLCLRSVPDSESCDLVVAALARDQATIVDTRESVYHIPPTMRTDEGNVAYVNEVRQAEQIASRLGLAIERYRQAMDGGWEGRLKGAGPSKGELKAKLRFCASANFWTKVETNLGLLFAHVAALGTDEAQPSRDVWRAMLFSTACETYRTICGQGTPRHAKAFAIGWDTLARTPKDASSKSEATEEDAA